MLDGYLWQTPREGKHPAVVFLHGCGGILGKTSRKPLSRETAWAKALNDRGYSVLAVDSFTPRGYSNMCAPATFVQSVFDQRPADAYAALAYVQSQPFVDPSKVAVMGWSQGGGVTLLSIGEHAPPHNAPGFVAAVAFYPGSCTAGRLGANWSSTIPLLVLVGAKDVWTPAVPCQSALHASKDTELKIYPDTYHDFDWPNLPVHQLPQYTTRAGVVPIEGENPAAHADALKIVPAFLEEYLGR